MPLEVESPEVKPLPDALVEEPARTYQCPGEAYTIDRPVHLFRLAHCYPACQACPHRHDSAPLPQRLIRRQAETQRRAAAEPLFTAEAAAGVALNQLSAQVAYRLGQSLGVNAHRRAQAESLPEIVIASDGRPAAAEVLAAAAEGLRWSGCQLIDIGTATAAGLAWAIEQTQSAGGLLVANPLNGPHTVGIRFWLPGPHPCSSPGELDAIAQLWRDGCTRPTRHCGQVRRADFEASYLERLRPYFHAMRPLRMVLSTDGHALLRGLDQLRRTVRASVIGLPGPSRAAQDSASATPLEVATQTVRQEVLARDAHFGMFVDSDGELCRVIDERGQIVSPARLLSLLARQIAGGMPDPAGKPATLVIGPGFSKAELAPIAQLGCQAITAAAGRDQMSAAIRRTRAALGVESSGRYWFPDNPGAADALQLLALLMTSLSQSDRPLSEVSANAY